MPPRDPPPPPPGRPSPASTTPPAPSGGGPFPRGPTPAENPVGQTPHEGPQPSAPPQGNGRRPPSPVSASGRLPSRQRRPRHRPHRRHRPSSWPATGAPSLGLYLRLYGAPPDATPVSILQDLRLCFDVPIPHRTVLLPGPGDLRVILLPSVGASRAALSTDLSFSSQYRLEPFHPVPACVPSHVRQLWVQSIRRVLGTHQVFQRV